MTAVSLPPRTSPTPLRSGPGAPSPLAVLRAPFEAETWFATAHVLTGLLVAAPTFGLALAGLVTGASMLPALLLGVPVLVLTLLFAHAIAKFERARLAAFTGVVVPGFTLGPDGRTFLRRLRSDGLWRELAYVLLHFPVAAFSFAVVIGAWFWGFGFTVWAIAGAGPGALLPAAVLLLSAPWLARGAAQIDVTMAQALLGPKPAVRLAARVNELEGSRSAVVSAGDAERIRLERDLHDGAQQSLVALAMTLGRARAKLDADPAAAKLLLDEAHGDAKRALAELRDLARGIHPAVLTDRGLDAALSALAARSPVPVSVSVELDRRPSAAVEAVAYFVVAEALTNVAKHAFARTAAVHVVQTSWALYLTVLDDGVGGASFDTGSGLAGLRDRVSAVDGRVALASPINGPTELTVELPCA